MRVITAVAVLFVSSLFAANVRLTRVPDGGIQPQAATDEHGTVHVVYYRGDAAAGDLFYTRSTDRGFSVPIRVNSTPGSAIAVGNVRGARIAVGRGGRVYVAWNGSRAKRSPMLFTRLNDQGTAFEPERNLIHDAWGLDGGGGIAADHDGRVYVFWHAPLPGTEGEENRRVWIAKSDDDGKTFAPERVAWNGGVGTCGCCALSASTDRDGNVFVLVRSVRDVVHRDMYLLASRDHGASFAASDISKWDVGQCVMSTAALAHAPGGMLAAWETEKQIHFGQLDSAGELAADLTPAAAPSVNRKHPAIAVNDSGEILLAWTEGMGWKQGGSLHWQVFDRNGKAEEPHGTADGVPAWSLVAAYTRPDGSFTILY